VRWLGHRLHAEINLAVSPQLTVSEAHKIAVETERGLLEKVNYLSSAIIHVDPLDASGESHHQAETKPEHKHKEH
jgi:divalent metal cation (Fe/Co/Zn/Cd) transporter